MKKEIKLAWLAGIMEGEGCFSINSAGKNRNYFVYCISITNTDLIILQKCVSILKEIGIGVRIKSRNKQIKNRRMRYDLKIEGIKKMICFINAINPYIVGQKKMQAELMLNFLKRRLKIIDFNKGKSPRRRAYDIVDYSYLEAMKKLRDITVSVETERSLSLWDKVTVRAANINKIAETSRNDLFLS